MNTLPRTMTPAPKPAPMKGKRKAKPKTKSICVECGEIWRGPEVKHAYGCNQNMRVIRFNKVNKTDKQMYEAALDYICRLITEWRDGCTCVINSHYCNDVSQWGHVIPQGRNAYLVYELSNSFRQCAKHNELHRDVQAPYLDWYRNTWGLRAYNLLNETRETHTGGRQDLLMLLMEYVALYENRFKYSTASKEELVLAGYYGNVIREAWVKDGRI